MEKTKGLNPKYEKKKSVSPRLGLSWQFFQEEFTVDIFIIFSKHMRAALRHQMWNINFNFL